MVEKRKYNVSELAHYLRVSKWTIYKLVSHDKIPHTHIGSRLIFDSEEIDAWLQEDRRYWRK